MIQPPLPLGPIFRQNWIGQPGYDSLIGTLCGMLATGERVYPSGWGGDEVLTRCTRLA